MLQLGTATRQTATTNWPNVQPVSSLAAWPLLWSVHLVGGWRDYCAKLNGGTTSGQASHKNSGSSSVIWCVCVCVRARMCVCAYDVSLLLSFLVAFSPPIQLAAIARSLSATFTFESPAAIQLALNLIEFCLFLLLLLLVFFLHNFQATNLHKLPMAKICQTKPLSTVCAVVYTDKPNWRQHLGGQRPKAVQDLSLNPLALLMETGHDPIGMRAPTLIGHCQQPTSPQATKSIRLARWLTTSHKHALAQLIAPRPGGRPRAPEKVHFQAHLRARMCWRCCCI